MEKRTRIPAVFHAHDGIVAVSVESHISGHFVLTVRAYRGEDSIEASFDLDVMDLESLSREIVGAVDRAQSRLDNVKAALKGGQ